MFWSVLISAPSEGSVIRLMSVAMGPQIVETCAPAQSASIKAVDEPTVN